MSKLLKLATNYEALSSYASEEGASKITINQLSDLLAFLSEKIGEYPQDDVPPTLLYQYKHVEHLLEKRLSDLMVN